jgi:transposase
MLADPPPDRVLAQVVDAVVGGDTHRDAHALEMTAPSGAPLATTTVANTDDGFAHAIGWIAAHAPGPRIVVALEGTRSYGIGLARAAAAAGLTVIEVDHPARAQRRRRGKSDPIDAHLAALHALRLPADRLPIPRADGDREALRILLVARQELTTTNTAQINRLRALLLTGDDTDRAAARARLSSGWLTGLTRRRGRPGDTREQIVRGAEIRRLATAIRANTAALNANRQQLRDIVDELRSGLLSRRGIGPVSAAQAIVSWSHPGRCRNDAAFAALAGANPIPASSGRITRHRLNRGGDRDLNRALHAVALTRWRCCPRTAAYITRRRAEGKTDNEIRRCLKRYIARELYRALNTTPTPTPAAPTP